jgi:16S rRNA processing protein RimM
MSADAAGGDAHSPVTVGKIGAPYGVRGWLKVHSFTDPANGILDYKNWSLAQAGKCSETELVEGKVHGKGLVVRLRGIDDRDRAALLTGAEIQISRSSLPDLDEGYYWMDLIGMEVVDREGTSFGKVASMMETGANDVMVIKGERERLVPWIMDEVVLVVDRAEGRITVDWDADF